MSQTRVKTVVAFKSGKGVTIVMKKSRFPDLREKIFSGEYTKFDLTPFLDPKLDNNLEIWFIPAEVECLFCMDNQEEPKNRITVPNLVRNPMPNC